MGLLVGIANLVVLLIVIESWVKGRIPEALARTLAERMNDPGNLSNRRLDGLDRRLGELGTRLDGLDRRTGELAMRLDGLDRRLGELDTRIDGLDRRVRGFDTRIDRVDAQVAVLNAQASKQISDLDRHVQERLRALDSRLRAPATDAGETPS